MPVITAIKLDDLWAIRKPTGNANGRHAGFGARVAHANLLDAGNRGLNHLGHAHLQWIGDAKTRSPLRGCLHRADDLRVSMPKNCRAPGAHIIDVFIAIDVPNSCPLCAIDKKRLPAHPAKCPDRRIHAPGNMLKGSFK